MLDWLWKLLAFSPWLAAIALIFLEDRIFTKRAKRNAATYQLSINMEKTDV